MVELPDAPAGAASVRRFAMLSDHEQRALLELQRQFLAEDPDLDEVGQRDSGFSFQWVDAMPRWVPTAAVVGTVALGLLILAIGVAAVALVSAMLAMMTVVARKRRARGSTRFQDGPHER
jgi:hypothetical protein